MRIGGALHVLLGLILFAAGYSLIGTLSSAGGPMMLIGVLFIDVGCLIIFKQERL